MNDKALNTRTIKNIKNWGVSSNTAKADSHRVSESFENLSITIKLAYSKKPKFTKFQKSDLVKANFPKRDFFASKAKEAFIHRQKVFSYAIVLRRCDPKYNIWIKTNALRYAIDKMLS